MATETTQRFADQFLEDLTVWLQRREDADRVVSEVGTGAAFEVWLAFEARLAMLAGKSVAMLPGVTMREQVWTANEYPRKTDLAVGRWGDQTPLAAVEFKLIHNNKDWKKKADQVWRDLFPPSTPKASMKTALDRLAVVGVVGKTYQTQHANHYPGQQSDYKKWQEELWCYVTPDTAWEGQQVHRISGPRHFEFDLGGRPTLLDKKKRHFLDLYVLAGSRTG